MPALNDGVLHTIELTLLERQNEALNGRRELAGVRVKPLDIATARAMGSWDDEPLTWSLFRSMLHDEFGIASQDRDPFEEEHPDEWVDPSPGFDALRTALWNPDPGRAIRWLAARAALRRDGDFPEGDVGLQLITPEVKRLHAAYEESERASLLRRVTFRAHNDYARQLRHRTLSLRIWIVLLTTTELLALGGLLSPGRPYAGLFVVTAALVAGSVMNVAGGALVDLS